MSRELCQLSDHEPRALPTELPTLVGRIARKNMKTTGVIRMNVKTQLQRVSHECNCKPRVNSCEQLQRLQDNVFAAVTPQLPSHLLPAAQSPAATVYHHTNYQQPAAPTAVPPANRR